MMKTALTLIALVACIGIAFGNLTVTTVTQYGNLMTKIEIVHGATPDVIVPADTQNLSTLENSTGWLFTNETFNGTDRQTTFRHYTQFQQGSGSILVYQ